MDVWDMIGPTIIDDVSGIVMECLIGYKCDIADVKWDLHGILV